MRVRSALIGLVMLASAGTVVAVPAEAAPARGLPVLTGTTVISAAKTGFVRVRVAAPIVMPASPHPDGPTPQLHVSDLRRFQALILVADKALYDGGIPVHPDVTVYHMPSGDRQLFQTYKAPQIRTNSPISALPAGTYRLYVVASGPVSLTWRLPLAGGTRSLRTVDRPASAKVVTTTSTPAVPGAPVPPHIYLESTFTVGNVGAFFGATRFQGYRVGDKKQPQFCFEPADNEDLVSAAGLPVGDCTGGGGASMMPIVGLLDTGTRADTSTSVSSSMSAYGNVFDRPAKVNTFVLPSVRFKYSEQTAGVVLRADAIQIWYSLD